MNLVTRALGCCSTDQLNGIFDLTDDNFKRLLAGQEKWEGWNQDGKGENRAAIIAVTTDQQESPANVKKLREWGFKKIYSFQTVHGEYMLHLWVRKNPKREVYPIPQPEDKPKRVRKSVRSK